MLPGPEIPAPSQSHSSWRETRLFGFVTITARKICWGRISHFSSYTFTQGSIHFRDEGGACLMSCKQVHLKRHTRRIALPHLYSSVFTFDFLSPILYCCSFLLSALPSLAQVCMVSQSLCISFSLDLLESGFVPLSPCSSPTVVSASCPPSPATVCPLTIL